jgi:hypothetical protein
MHPRLAHIDLPEARNFRPQFDVREKRKKALVLELVFERDLRAG